ncbi:hypothetical protein M3Y99_00491000 [Aphelenchoides fujianensis]|nr:hypothetical protein M3Y99_00491000 [Aphelenchoides fujianensis]
MAVAHPPSSRTQQTQRLYQRQHSGLQSVENSPTGTHASIFNASSLASASAAPASHTPMHSSTSSPLNSATADPFAWWLPNVAEEKSQAANTWSTVYNWMHSSSGNSSGTDECNESTKSGSDNMNPPTAGRPFTWSTAEAELPVFGDAARPAAAAPNFHHPQPIRVNDENVVNQMLRLSMAEQHEQQAFAQQRLREQQRQQARQMQQQHENGGLLMRKWSNESDHSDVSALHYAQTFHPQQQPARPEGANHRQVYAPYVNSEEPDAKRWPSSIEQFVLHSLSSGSSNAAAQDFMANKTTPHYIPANSEKWSTASDSQQQRAGPTDAEVRQMIAKQVRQLLLEQQQQQQRLHYEQAKQPTVQQVPQPLDAHRRQGSLKRMPQQRQVFAPLNSGTQQPTSPIQQRPGVSCDEAELQWYHQNLELQQCVYDRIYSMVLSGQLVPQNKRSGATNAQAEIPTATSIAAQRNARFAAAVSSPASSANLTSPSTDSVSPPAMQRSSLERMNGFNSAAVVGSFDTANKLDQCTAQYRQLEKERKKTEAELAKHNLGKKISSSNTLPIPRLPPAPSRIDRLVVDFFREHARVITLLTRMEQLRGASFEENLHQTMREWFDAIRLLQQRRLCERNAILSHLHGDGSYDEERESANLNEALVNLTKTAIRARSANWCALVQTLGVEDHAQHMQLQRLVSVDYNCEPSDIRVRPVNA